MFASISYIFAHHEKVALQIHCNLYRYLFQDDKVRYLSVTARQLQVSIDYIITAIGMSLIFCLYCKVLVPWWPMLPLVFEKVMSTALQHVMKNMQSLIFCKHSVQNA